MKRMKPMKPMKLNLALHTKKATRLNRLKIKPKLTKLAKSRLPKMLNRSKKLTRLSRSKTKLKSLILSLTKEVTKIAMVIRLFF